MAGDKQEFAGRFPKSCAQGQGSCDDLLINDCQASGVIFGLTISASLRPRTVSRNFVYNTRSLTFIMPGAADPTFMTARTDLPELPWATIDPFHTDGGIGS